MSEQELNSYRFTSHEEPTDEMLSQIMKEAVQDAIARQKQAMRHYQEEMEKQRALLHARWDDKLKSLIHG
ncbi:hypothetical protein HDR68_03680 [bacterium]|nr:hypothetical protein [bacterium]